MSPPTLTTCLSLSAAAAVGGVLAGALAHRAILRTADPHLKPRWPRDWPSNRDIFTKAAHDARKPGYLDIHPRLARETGHTPLGRTWPRLTIFPDVFPFQELRRMVRFATSRPIFLPYRKRFQHLAIFGGTGKGKSTSYVVPQLAFGALESQTAYFALDVKSPELARALGALYRESGKPVFFFDPTLPDETLACEPIWRAHDEKKSMIAEVIASYSSEGTNLQATENTAFFKDKAAALLRALLDLAQYWPRRYCNLPCVQQLVRAGANAIREALLQAPAITPDPSILVEAAERVVATSDEALLDPKRSEELATALDVVDRAGYRVARLVQEMRTCVARRKARTIDDAKYERTHARFVAQLTQEGFDRARALQSLIQSQGEFLNVAEETRGGIVATLAGKLRWLEDANIARAFGRDELDVEVLIRQPCLVLIGAPLGRPGASFWASILANLSLDAVLQRGQLLNRQATTVSKHGVFFVLDEFAQLHIPRAPMMLQTFRGFLSGVTIILQERASLRRVYGEQQAIEMEGCLTHKILLQGAHEDTSEYFATKKIGSARIVKRSRSGVAGEKHQVTESVELVPRMTSEDVSAMMLNGRQQEGMALSVGLDVPAFPLYLTPSDQSPESRRLLGLRPTIDKRGDDGRMTPNPLKWHVRWEARRDAQPIHGRRKLRGGPALADDEAAAMRDRVHDPYRATAEFLIARAPDSGPADPLIAPRLSLADVGVLESDPTRLPPTAPAPEAPSPGPAPESPASQGGTNRRSAGEAEDVSFVRVYPDEFRMLSMADCTPDAPVPDAPLFGGTLPERVLTYQRFMAMGDDEHGLVWYVPSAQPGKVERRNSDGRTVRYVSADDYYARLLGSRMNAASAFIAAALPGRVPASHLPTVDAAIARTYWDQYLAVLTPPAVLASLVEIAAQPAGPAVVGRLEAIRSALFTARTLDEAAAVHAVARAQLLVDAAQNRLLEVQLTVAELFADYLMVQRAVSEDVRIAERQSASSPTDMNGSGGAKPMLRAVALDWMDQQNALQYYRILTLVHVPQRVAERLPARAMPAVLAFAARRQPLDGSSIFRTAQDESAVT